MTTIRDVGDGMRFTLWALQRSKPFTARDICRAFGVSRATGYRWLNLWIDVLGTQPTSVIDHGGLGRRRAAPAGECALRLRAWRKAA